MTKHAEYRDLNSLALRYVRKMENDPCLISRERKKADAKFSIQLANMASCTVSDARR